MDQAKHFLFDASALVCLLIKNPTGEVAAAKRRLAHLLASRDGDKRSIFLVPNFCMAECSKALAKIFLNHKPTESSQRAYRQHIEVLLDFVSSQGRHIIKTHLLERDHLVDIEDIFIADHRLDSRDGDPLSGLDGLIIAMARVIERKHGRGTVSILTTDRRIVSLYRKNPTTFPIAINIYREEIPGT